jgi:hypothetical protein
MSRIDVAASVAQRLSCCVAWGWVTFPSSFPRRTKCVFICFIFKRKEDVRMYQTYPGRVIQRTILGALLGLIQLPLAGAERIDGSHSLPSAEGRIIRVGPEQALRSISEASRQAGDNDIILVDAGDYYGDVAVWVRNGVTVRGVGGRVRLIASGASAEHKAIWVVRGGSMMVENIEFVGTRVPEKNGAARWTKPAPENTGITPTQDRASLPCLQCWTIGSRLNPG